MASHYFGKKVPLDGEVWKNVDFLSSETIGLKVVPGVDLAKNRKLSNQIANIMVNRFGWRKGRKRINGKNNRGYVKK